MKAASGGGDVTNMAEAEGVSGSGVPTPKEDGPGRIFALAAAPLFFLMAVWPQPSSGLALLCGPEPMGGLSEMQRMYLLMALVHSAPWWQGLRRRLTSG